MPGYLTDKCIEIRNWLAIGSEVYPDPVVHGWIRMAEEYLSTVLRVKHMIQIDTSTLTAERVPLPRDWQETRLLRILPNGGVGRYQTPDEFYNPEFPDDPGHIANDRKRRRYTILGNFLVIGDTSITPGLQVELTYYQDIPTLTDLSNNWINYYHPTIYTLKILHIASLYAIEDERSGVWDKEITRFVGDMNNAHRVDRASGSTLVSARRKSFG
jgi:hypothetical protein